MGLYEIDAEQMAEMEAFGRSQRRAHCHGQLHAGT